MMVNARDAKLVSRVAAGDAAALEQLYEETIDGLYAFVFYRVGRDSTIAEDVVQDTYLQALDQLDRFDAARGPLRSWLRTMSRNVIRRHLKRLPRAAELDAMWNQIDSTLAELFSALDGGPLSDELIAREQTCDLVSMTVANLPEHYRTVLERKYIEGDSLEELAQALATTPDAVKSLLARARRAFRATFLTLSRALVLEARP